MLTLQIFLLLGFAIVGLTAGYSCVVKSNTNSPGYAYGATGSIATVGDCQKLCLSTSGCISAIYQASTQTCWTKPQTDPETAQTGVYTIYCGQPCIVKSNTNSAGNAYGVTGSIATVGACQNLCLSTSGCISAIYEASTQSCWPKPQTDPETAQTGVYTMYCGSQCVVKSNTNSAGYATGKTGSIATVGDCQKLCLSTSGCISAIYEASTQSCWTKPQTDPETAQTGVSTIYCPPRCVVKSNTNSPGYATGKTGSIASVGACQSLCLSTSGCISAIYEASTQSCWTKPQTDPETAQTGVYTIYCGGP